MPRKKQNLWTLPVVRKREIEDIPEGLPIKHLSYSGIVQFTVNPIMFKIRNVNGDHIETTSGITGVIGSAFHHAMDMYWGFPTNDESGAIEAGLKGGMAFLDEYQEGWIEWSDKIPNKQKALEILAFCYTEYVKAKPRKPNEVVIACEERLMEYVSFEWKGTKLEFPVALKGRIDKISRIDGKIKITDYKTCNSFSDPDTINGDWMIQAIHYYFLVYVYTGEQPYSIIFEEVKRSKDRNGEQVKSHEIVYAKNDLYFDFYIRLYGDIIRSLAGEQVYVPNVKALYDREVSIISYIHRLDMSEEQAALMKKHKVDNLTDLLKEKIQSAGNMRQLMKTVEEKFVSARNLNYDRMKPEEKIATKLMEHGLMVQFHSVVDGATVQLYQYTPSVGLKMKHLTGFASDIEQVLGISNIRVLAPIPNSTLVGFEVPKSERYFPALPDHDGSFNIALGQTIMGETRRFDIRLSPHMLVAGASGSGKSFFITSLITQLSNIKNAELHLFDPKMVELSMYQDYPGVREYHSDIMDIHDALERIVALMNKRYKEMAKARVRNSSEMPNMPYKFVVIDEYGDLIAAKHIIKHKEKDEEGKIKTTFINISEEIAQYVLILAQKARAAGIHVVIATQRPSTDVVSGTIKANFPTKVVFRVAKAIDSQVVIDESGAEKLAGKGDMLFSSVHGLERLQGYSV